jgi:predicted GH43/DUF377 family glycosyl hydrolase
MLSKMACTGVIVLACCQSVNAQRADNYEDVQRIVRYIIDSGRNCIQVDMEENPPIPPVRACLEKAGLDNPRLLTISAEIQVTCKQPCAREHRALTSELPG